MNITYHETSEMIFNIFSSSLQTVDRTNNEPACDNIFHDLYASSSSPPIHVSEQTNNESIYDNIIHDLSVCSSSSHVIEQTNNEPIYDNNFHDLYVSSSSSSQIYTPNASFLSSFQTSATFDDDLNASFSSTSQIQALESNLTLDDPISDNDKTDNEEICTEMREQEHDV
ncbi:1012_t:CDS:2 [Gigaspora rosea]|nr:1012_t:CDS:2 [Gigaspora rosea]